MLMKATAKPILNRFGFKRVLVFNAVLSSLFLVIYGLFTPTTSEVLVLAALLGGGFLRSLQFTSINALAYADIDAPAMSRATSFASVAQQLSLSTGVAAGAAAIELSQWWHADASLSTRDFSVAFFAVAAISASACFVFARLPVDAGDLLRGARKRDAAAAWRRAAASAISRPRDWPRRARRRYRGTRSPERRALTNRNGSPSV